MLSHWDTTFVIFAVLIGGFTLGLTQVNHEKQETTQSGTIYAVVAVICLLLVGRGTYILAQGFMAEGMATSQSYFTAIVVAILTAITAGGFGRKVAKGPPK